MRSSIAPTINRTIQRDGGGGGSGPSYSVAVDAFSQPDVIFGTGTDTVRQVAIPVSGTSDAPEGTDVELRAVSLDDGGAQSQPWQTVGTVQPGGAWSGVITVPRIAGTDLAMQPRVGTSTGAVSASRFSTGHIIFEIGQSEAANLMRQGYDNVPNPTITDDKALQVVFALRSASEGVADSTLDLARHYVTQANIDDDSGLNAYVTAALGHLSNTLAAAAPGVRFLYILNAKGGTTFVGTADSLSDDSHQERLFSVDKAIYDYAIAVPGQAPDIVFSSWTAAPRSLGLNWGAAYAAVIMGRNMDGTPFTGNSLDFGGSVYTIDHTYAELGMPASVKHVIADPHSYIPTEDMDSATLPAGSTVENSLAKIEENRVSIRNLLATPALSSHFLYDEPSFPMHYLNGRDGTDAANPDIANLNWGDPAHPNGYDVDGCARRAKLLGNTFARAFGFIAFDTPRLDTAAWAPDNSYLDLSSTAGALTTERLARGLPALDPQTFSHWTEVAGFEINNTPAQDVTVTPEGKIRVRPNGGGAFAPTDSVQFGEGGATGQIRQHEDNYVKLFLNLPVVQVSGLVGGIHGVMPLPKPDPALLSPPINAFNISAAGPTFQSPNNATMPANTGQVTFYAHLNADAANTNTIFLGSYNSQQGKVEWLNNGALRLYFKDDDNGVRYTQTHALALARGVYNEIMVHVDYVAGDVRIFLGGAEVAGSPFAMTAGAASAPSNRYLTLLGREAVASTYYPAIGAVLKAGVWLDSAPVETSPGVWAPPADGAAEVVLQGGAAAVNASPWKQRADAT